MVTTYTDLLGLAKPASGDEGWGLTLNGTLDRVDTILGTHWVNVRDPQYGAVGDGVTDDAAAIDAAQADAGTTKALFIPRATYRRTTPFRITQSNVRVLAETGAEIYFTGSGNVMEVDAGESPAAGIFGVEVHGLRLRGTGAANNGLFLRGVARSRFRGIRVHDVVTAGLSAQWCVSNVVELRVSLNDAAWIQQPTYGAVFDRRAVGEYSTDTVLLNPVLEGVASSGIYYIDAKGMVVLGGTSEANGEGVTMASTNDYHTFINHWMEANSVRDATIQGNGHSFIGCRFGTSSPGADNVSVASAASTVFSGGYIRVVNLASSSYDTVFLAVTFSDNGSLGIQGAGTYSRLGCTLVDTAGARTGSYPNYLSGGPVGLAVIPSASGAQGPYFPTVATASLPAAGADNNGLVVIEDAGAGDRNLIVYAGGQRFRVDGGAPV